MPQRFQSWMLSCRDSTAADKRLKRLGGEPPSASRIQAAHDIEAAWTLRQAAEVGSDVYHKLRDLIQDAAIATDEAADVYRCHTWACVGHWAAYGQESFRAMSSDEVLEVLLEANLARAKPWSKKLAQVEWVPNLSVRPTCEPGATNWRRQCVASTIRASRR